MHTDDLCVKSARGIWKRRTLKFGLEYARRLKRRHGHLGDTWHLDEVFIKIQGKRQYLWRAVEQDGDVLDILVQPRRDRKAAKRFFRKLLKGQARPPWRLVIDKLKSYRAAHREVMPSVVTTPTSTETIEPKSRTSRRDNGNDRCGSLSLRDRRNDS